MKKQFIAKLLVLAMVLAMLPLSIGATFAEVGATVGNNTYNDDYNNGNDVTVPDEPIDVPVAPTTPKPAESEAPAPEPEVVEKVEDVKTETNDEGKTIVTATVEVKDDTAPVEVSEAAVDALVEQVSEGDVLTIVAATTGDVTVHADKLAEAVAKTGNPVTVGNTVASVAVNSALLEVAGSAPVTVAPVANDDGTITVTVKAGDKEIAPESVKGGIAVEVPVTNTANISAVYVVKADGTRVAAEFEIVNGKLQVKMTVSGKIQISRS